MRAVVVEQTGGPENLVLTDLPDPIPGPDEALVKVEAIGVNFIDVYFRAGIYSAPESPIRLGNEAAGTIEKAPADSGFKSGDRVAYAMVRGSYAQYAVVPLKMLVKLPPSISFEQGAAVMLQGMTAHYLSHSTFPLKQGQTCLVHAAAGGTGLLLVQLARRAGATVLCVVRNAGKAEMVQRAGATHVFYYDDGDWVHAVRELTGGQGVDVVYDSVGQATFQGSLDCLRPRGMLVSFGQSSGAVGGVDPLLLSQKGSLFLTRPSLGHYIAGRQELDWRTSDLFGAIAKGELNVAVYRTYSLAEAAEAHRDLESRQTTGKLLLKP